MSKTYNASTICIVAIILNFYCKQIDARSNVSARIVGGHVTRIEKLPYLLQLFVKGRLTCAASLIARSYAVTAGHCVKGITAKYIHLVGGATTINQAGSKRSVIVYYMSSAYNGSTMNKDVALLKLSQPMTGNGTKPIRLCSKPNWRSGSVVTVSGWGLTSEYSKTPSNQVRSVNLPLISRSECQNKYRKAFKLTKSMICTHLPGRKDACNGDSGGCLTYKGKLCGIVSWGFGCASEFPGVYTSVPQIRTFLKNNMHR